MVVSGVGMALTSLVVNERQVGDGARLLGVAADAWNIHQNFQPGQQLELPLAAEKAAGALQGLQWPGQGSL
jgi:hypothetical protein